MVSAKLAGAAEPEQVQGSIKTPAKFGGGSAVVSQAAAKQGEPVLGSADYPDNITQKS